MRLPGKSSLGPSGLKNRQANYWPVNRLSVASEIQELILCEPDGEPKRILDGNFSARISHTPAQRPHIRDEDSTLHVVIVVKTFSSIEGKLPINTPRFLRRSEEGRVGKEGRSRWSRYR